jgi:hypothetical protein
MAVIVVETGSGSSTANSYVSAVDLATYATDRGVTLTGTAAVLLIQAMDYLESQVFIGDKNTQAQALQWPRSNAYIDNFYQASDAIPRLLIDALCELCIAIDGGTNPLANQGRETRREKIGEIEIEYAPGSRAETYLTAAHSKLNKLTKGNGVNVRVCRG